jgi:hypothetical protein
MEESFNNLKQQNRKKKNILSLDNPLHWMMRLMLNLHVKSNGSVIIIMHCVIQAIIMAEKRVNCVLK